MMKKSRLLLFPLVALPLACTPNDTVAREDASTAPDAVADAAPDVVASDTPPADAPPADAPSADVLVPTDVASDAVQCGNVPMPASHLCTAATPTAEPGCRCVIGAYWNGSACAFLGGCRCTAGCDRVYPTMEACDAAHRTCRDGGTAADAGATFACGPTLRCQTGRQYCHETVPGVPGASPSYRCGDLPAGCARCTCIPEATTPGTVCNDATPGEITVRVLLP